MSVSIFSTIPTLVAVGTNDRLHYPMILLIHNLEFPRPERSEFCDPGLGGA